MQVSKNCLGTATFIYKFTGMKKEQEFDVYPMDKKSSEKVITIQSNTRIGHINLDTGKVKLSKPHTGGAYFHHLSMDTLLESTLHAEDLNTLKNAIIGTAGELVGNNCLVYCDNSKAELIK
jgi:hypothetical protein